VGGGKIFTPKPRSYEKKMPRKMRRAALRSALSVKLSTDDFLVVDAFSLEAPKTRLMKEALEALVGEQSALVLFPEKNEEYELLWRSIRNLPDAKILLVDYLNIKDLLGYDKVILVRPALDKIMEHLSLEQHDEVDL
jgi:large subunit ribosomal protein L4